jgi:transposase-like protein
MAKSHDKASTLKFMRKAMERYGKAKVVVTDKLRSYGDYGRYRKCQAPGMRLASQ